jgi:crotonobetainyl-CoA:carnitine CoA-transferase CaiB-like acyl-CoA transferase
MADAIADIDRPLRGIRILDAVDGPLQTVGRILADLGAEVLRVEGPEGSPARRRGVVVDSRNLTFEARNAGETGLVIDLDAPEGRERFAALSAAADVVLRDGSSEVWDHEGVRTQDLRARHPRLVVVDLSDFGVAGSGSDRLATPDVHAALSTVLSRSGLPGVAEPLLPPEFLLYESAAVQAVWIVLLELAHVRATGVGDAADFSVQEGLIQILDPVFGVGGSARAGVPLRDLPRGRPDARHLYPIFRARDGWVRICVLSKRQWHGMFEWLGCPDEFADPRFDNTMVRFAAAPTLYPLIGAMFADMRVEDAVEQGQALNVPVASLDEADGVLAQPAFRDNGSFVEAPDGGVVHHGWYEIDDVRVGAAGRAPRLGEDVQVSERQSAGVRVAPDAHPGRMPFEGLRVLDLGVIVVGSELGRLFADYGADVIKIESSAFPDGTRQSQGSELISEGASLGLRNRRSLGLDLKREEGKALFSRLVERSDVVLTNFKPGTLASLGFDMDALHALNPGIVLSESSAFGNHGSWSRRLGYGPLVRASAGLSSLWRYPDLQDGFSDAITIFPDHVVARLNAAAVVALLLRRDRTGRGGRISTAQVDAIFGAMADSLWGESLRPGTGARAEGNDRRGDGFRGLYPAAGDDEWVVVDAVGDERFAAVATTIGRGDLLEDVRLASPDGRDRHRRELRHILSHWTSERTAEAAAAALQSAGVPAGRMLRLDDIEVDEHLRQRGVFGELEQPQFRSTLPANLGEARFDELPPPRLQPAPLAAQDTRTVLRDVLGMPEAGIQRLLDNGVLEEHPEAAPVAVGQSGGGEMTRRAS